MKRVLLLNLLLFVFSPSVFILHSQAWNNPVTGSNGMVATAHPLASEAAIQVLKLGGNAVDAAVAAAFAIGVVEPDGSGLGGGGGMVIYLEEEEEPYYINYYARASENGSKSGYRGKKDAFTAKSICVPGTVAGLLMAHDEFGSLPREKVMAPAIQYASEGFPIDATLARLILDNIETVLSDEATAAVFCEEGFPRMEGDIVVQEDLARTLSVISKEGRKAFYEGSLTRKMVDGIAERGGALSMNDFASYKAELTKPLRGTYRGYDVLTANIPQSGICLIEALNILENEDLSSKPHYSESADILHLIAEAERYTYADRTAYLGDPGMVEVPVEGMLSKKYARERYSQINREHLSPPAYRDITEGDPYTYNSQHAGAVSEELPGGHTTHLSVIDKDGNAVSLTQTLGLFFGSGQMVSGVLFNCAMTNFSYRTKTSPNIYRDGKQSRSSIMPTILMKDGNPFLVAGSPGSARIITTMIEIVLNVVDYQMDVVEANLAPRFFVRDSEDYLYMESGILPEVRSELETMGHNIRVYEGIDLFFGGVQMIMVDPETGEYQGSADKRRGGVAMGY